MGETETKIIPKLTKKKNPSTIFVFLSIIIKAKNVGALNPKIKGNNDYIQPKFDLPKSICIGTLYKEKISSHLFSGVIRNCDTFKGFGTEIWIRDFG